MARVEVRPQRRCGRQLVQQPGRGAHLCVTKSVFSLACFLGPILRGPAGKAGIEGVAKRGGKLRETVPRMS